VLEDPGEHVNQKDAHPQLYARLKAALDKAVGVDYLPSGAGGGGGALGLYDAAGGVQEGPRVDDNAACTAMASKWGGFFGPFAGASPAPPSPKPPAPRPPAPGPAPGPRADCTWRNNTDYDTGSGGSLGPWKPPSLRGVCGSKRESV